MSNYREIRRDEPVFYEILVQGRLCARWSHWFEGLSICTHAGPGASGQTTLAGSLSDQAALLGVLQKLNTLGLPLLQVMRKE